MACQMAKHVFGVSRVVSRVFDPIREEMYRQLGLRTINPTRVQASLMKEVLERDEAPAASDA
jgi:trk system potassium uptake protein TrkA